MPLVNAVSLLFALGAVIVLCDRFKVMPLLALMAVTALYCLGQGEEPHWFAKEFSQGFGQTVAASGLALLAGAMVAAFAEKSGATSWLYDRTKPWRDAIGPISMAAPIALVAGLGGNAIAAFAVASPLIRAVSGGRRKITLAAGLLINVSQSCLIPSPAPIAAMAILGADWRLMLAFGIPTAVVQSVLGMVALHHAKADDDAEVEPFVPAPPNRRAAMGLMAAIGILLALLILTSLGQMPSEPLGSGDLREQILGAGRPMILLLAGVGIMAVALFFTRSRWPSEAVAETGWLAKARDSSASIILLAGAAGGLQMSLQNNGMAELLAEHLLFLPVGLVLPFAVAALGKALHGSSLTAAITTAGMMQPLVQSLGLGDPSGTALTALAIGVGALAVPHINDGFFWVVGNQAQLSPGQTVKRFSVLILAQSIGALAFLVAVSVSR